MCSSVRAKCPLFLQISVNLDFVPTDLEQSSSIKFRSDPFSGSRAVRADRQTDGQTDTMKPTAAFRNVKNEPKN
jgi:hypothetical protein